MLYRVRNGTKAAIYYEIVIFLQKTTLKFENSQYEVLKIQEITTQSYV